MTEPIEARRSPDRSLVERALDRACGSRAIPDNRVTYLAEGPETFDAMLALIDGARIHVYFENYIIRDDETGSRFAARLAAAARRGAAVQVLYDHLGCRSTSRSFWRNLRDAGVSARAFNRINVLRPFELVQRDHRKYVSVDGEQAVVGGHCIGDEWTGRPDRGIPPWRDTAVRVEGPAVPALDATFRRNWVATGGMPLDAAPLVREPRGTAGIRVIDGLPGKLRLLRAIELLAAGAADRLWVTDAYLVALSPLYSALIAAARDGVDVRILVPGRTDIPAVRALTRVGYRELMEGGVRIWELHGAMLHAKTVVADGSWFKVGSSNLNPSSLLSNHELDLLIEDESVTTLAAQQFRRDLSQAVEIVLRARRGPGSLRARLPPAIVPAARTSRRRAPSTRRELRRRAVITLGQVAGGARRSIGGALVFISLGTGVLFLALPRVMAYVLATVSFGLAAAAAWEFLRRRAFLGE